MDIYIYVYRGQQHLFRVGILESLIYLLLTVCMSNLDFRLQ
jgi:hypothetical protein